MRSFHLLHLCVPAGPPVQMLRIQVLVCAGRHKTAAIVIVLDDETQITCGGDDPRVMACTVEGKSVLCLVLPNWDPISGIPRSQVDLICSSAMVGAGVSGLKQIKLGVATKRATSKPAFPQ